jgi:hypothetical protein
VPTSFAGMMNQGSMNYANQNQGSMNYANQNQGSMNYANQNQGSMNYANQNQGSMNYSSSVNQGNLSEWGSRKRIGSGNYSALDAVLDEGNLVEVTLLCSHYSLK